MAAQPRPGVRGSSVHLGSDILHFTVKAPHPMNRTRARPSDVSGCSRRINAAAGRPLSSIGATASAVPWTISTGTAMRSTEVRVQLQAREIRGRLERGARRRLVTSLPMASSREPIVSDMTRPHDEF